MAIRRDHRTLSMVVIAAALAIPSACAAPEQSDSVTQPAGLGAESDYDRVGTVKEAAAIADLVAEGVLVSVNEGRSFIVEPDDPALDDHNVVVGVRLGEVYQGSLGDKSDGIAYIELPEHVRATLETYQAALPKGTEVAVYLGLLPQEDPLYRDDTAGRPAGQQIWVPISPQGLVLADGAQSQELLSGMRFDAPLSAFLPPSTTFPPAISASEG